MHPCQETLVAYIALQTRQAYVEALQALLNSLELHDDYALGLFVGAAVIVPARPPATLWSLGQPLVQWVQARADLFPDRNEQKIILLIPGMSRGLYLDELGSLGAFDIGQIDEMLPALFLGYEAALRDIETMELVSERPDQPRRLIIGEIEI